MAKLVETVMIKDGGRERAVKVTIDAPSLENLDVPTLAQEAWISPRKILKVGTATVKVEKFGR
jgi:hypothetical protein